MAISLNNHIKNQKKKISQFDKALRGLALEVNGMFKDNIGKDRIKPKTIKKKGKTLFDTGTGQKGIVSLVRGVLIETGNFYKYMGYHLNKIKKTVSVSSHTRKTKTGTQNVDSHKRKMNTKKRNWLKTPKGYNKFIAAWQKEWIKK